MIPKGLDWRFVSEANPRGAGEGMYALMRKLYPLCRSITGDGLRRTLRLIREEIPIEICEVPSGTPVFDWTVPREWNIEEAFIRNSKGETVVDFRNSNLHVLNYSVPVEKKMKLAELKEHLFSIPAQPDRIPYRTSYYRENWGFCLPHRQLESLPEDTYEVVIRSRLEPGSMTYGELVVPGETDQEVLLSTYVCHPSVCNDNLSGAVLAVFLAKYLRGCKPRYTYRFLFIPETIGAIAWLALNETKVPRIRHGLVLTCVGDAGDFTYQQSIDVDAEIDRVVRNVLRDSGRDYKIIDFFPCSDERQYSSPAFAIPTGLLMRTPPDRFAEYHNSGDDLNFVQPRYLGESFDLYTKVLFTLDNDNAYVSLNPKGEPQLGKRSLYTQIGGKKISDAMDELAVLWVLNRSDGRHSLLEISNRSRVPFDRIHKMTMALLEKGLLKEAP